jgi:hypothetical protein
VCNTTPAESSILLPHWASNPCHYNHSTIYSLFLDEHAACLVPSLKILNDLVAFPRSFGCGWPVSKVKADLVTVSAVSFASYCSLLVGNPMSRCRKFLSSSVEAAQWLDKMETNAMKYPSVRRITDSLDLTTWVSLYSRGRYSVQNSFRPIWLIECQTGSGRHRLLFIIRPSSSPGSSRSHRLTQTGQRTACWSDRHDASTSKTAAVELSSVLPPPTWYLVPHARVPLAL